MVKEQQISTKVLDHLGLVFSVMNKIDLIEKVDNRLPLDKTKGSKVTMGQRVAAMIANGLGFIDDRLYMFPEFLENKPVERFFGNGIDASHFNDDALGRCLDAIYDYGSTLLFSEIAFEIGTKFKLLGKTSRFDTTSLIVYGDYKEKEEKESGDFCITNGYSKDGRPDLKQVVLNLATTGKANLPIWMVSQSGNASDKIVLQEAAAKMHKFAENLKEAPSFIFVGDSAMYEKCVEKAGDMLWLSRVPHSHKQAKKLLALPSEKFNWDSFGGYSLSLMLDQLQFERKTVYVIPKITDDQERLIKYFVTDQDGIPTEEFSISAQELKGISIPETLGLKDLSGELGTKILAITLERGHTPFEDKYKVAEVKNGEYKGVKQRWVMVFSKQMYDREVCTLNKKIDKELETKEKELRRLKGRKFACEKDAKKFANVFKKTLKYHNLDFCIQSKCRHKGRGRPKKNVIPEVEYQVKGSLTKAKERIAAIRQTKGRFILATNQMLSTVLSNTDMLYEYKQQTHTEAGFRFIKNDTFEVSRVFLKKKSRVQALMMIMTLCLMVYNLAQYFLRQALEEQNDTIPNQLKKPTKKPTMAYVCRIFHGVHVVYIETKTGVQEFVVNVKEILKKIIHYFGPVAERIYGIYGVG